MSRPERLTPEQERAGVVAAGDQTARLVGRRAECAALDEVVEKTRASRSSVLVVRGESGVGKSVLLDYVAERASGCRVARAGAVESEMELPLAGLQQLLGTSMLGRVENLPGPQRDALRLAFGLSEGPAPDRFLLGLAALSLLSDVAEEQPLMCVVDDVQWLDRESAQVLSFVARRLQAEPVGMVFAVREPSAVQELAGLPELVVQGLMEQDARVLLASGLPGVLDEQVRDRIVAETRGNPLALLTAPARLSPGFRPDVPGRYALRLSTRSGPTRTSDVVRLDAVPQSLLIQVDTMSGDPSNPGISFGGTNYRLAQATGSGPLQTLVLTRKHLGFVSNSRFSDAGALGSALGAMSADKLVIVSWQATGGFSGDLDVALAQIGWPKLGPIDKTRPGSLSAIGVPGMQRGDADAKLNQVAPGAPPRAGRIQGYLSPDQNREFGFVPSQRIPFSFKPTPRPPDTPRRCGATCAGLLVRFQDPYTLETEMVGYYALGDPSLSAADHNSQAAMMINQFGQAPGTLLTIRSVSTPTANGNYLPPVGPIDRPVLDQVADLVVDAGGTRDGFNSVARMSGSPASGGATYTLVGWKGAGEGAGAEAAAGANGATAAPVLTGVMRPNRQLQFRPESVKQNDNVTDRLSRVALELPTTSWPLDNNPDAMAALSWLGSQDPRLGANPRTAYWLQDFAAVGTWLDIANTIRAVTYSTGNGFSQDDFDKAKAQLLKELGLVFKVRSYTTQLSTVFQQSGQPAWAQTHVIADNIYQSVKPPDDETTLGWFEFAEILLDLAGPLTDDASSEVAELLEFAVWAAGASDDGAPTYDKFAVSADKLGAKLEELARNTQEAVSRMGDVIVNDYAKLSLVGQNALCKPGPGCPEGWSFTGDDVTQASADVNRSIQRLAYEKFIPMAYGVFQVARNGTFGGLPPIHRSAPPPDIAGYVCAHGYPEWPNAPRLAYTSLLKDLDPAGVDNWYDTLILHTPVRPFEAGSYPPDQMLNHMFKPVPDTSEPTDDGLGMNLNDMVRNADYSWFHGSLSGEESSCRWRY